MEAERPVGPHDGRFLLRVQRDGLEPARRGPRIDAVGQDAQRQDDAVADDMDADGRAGNPVLEQGRAQQQLVEPGAVLGGHFTGRSYSDRRLDHRVADLVQEPRRFLGIARAEGARDAEARRPQLLVELRLAVVIDIGRSQPVDDQPAGQVKVLEEAIGGRVQRLLVDVDVAVAGIGRLVHHRRQDGQGARRRAADMDRADIGEIDLAPAGSARRVDRQRRFAGPADLDVERDRHGPELGDLLRDFGNLRTVMVREKRNSHRHECPTPEIIAANGKVSPRENGSEADVDRSDRRIVADVAAEGATRR